jgi:hypothetical protein
MVKMVLRPTIAQHTGQKKREDKIELENLELELNHIENLKLKFLSKKTFLLTQDFEQKLKNVEVAKTILVNNLELLRNLSFR